MNNRSGVKVTFPRHLLLSKNLFPKKHMGQNFLVDPSTAEMIVRRANVKESDVAVEIGAGLGALTVPLARSVRRLYAVEKDRDLMELLPGVLSEAGISNTVLIHKNIFDVDLADIAEDEGTRLVVLGNLPYNISSQVVVRLIESRQAVDRAVFMFQKEMARRIAASPGGKDYGRLSVMVQYCATVKRIAGIGAHQFYPRPNIDSEVIEIDFLQEIAHQAKDEKILSEVVKAAFGQRRKTLKNALAGKIGSIPTISDRFWEIVGIDPKRRAETLTVDEFVVLANAAAACKESKNFASDSCSADT